MPSEAILHRNCNASTTMKTANLPSLRVDPELRKAAEAVLERGPSSRQRAARTSHYVPAAEVLQSLSDRLERARRR